MNKQDIAQRVKQTIQDHLGLPIGDINLESNLVDDLGADSLDKIEMVIAYEEEFDIEISDEDAEKIETVEQAIEYLANANKHSLLS